MMKLTARSMKERMIINIIEIKKEIDVLSCYRILTCCIKCYPLTPNRQCC